MAGDVPEHDSRPRPAERLLLETVPHVDAARVFCTSLGRAQFAAAIAEQRPQARVCCNFLDLYLAQLARQQHARHANLEILCQADWPAEEFDWAALPFSAQGDGELVRELLQAGHQTLRQGGTLWAATDNPQDRWLHAELGKLFDKVSCMRSADGVCYRVVKTRPLKKAKNYACQFAFRDRGRLLQVVSRPSVFSHRRIDTGARALIDTMEVGPGQRVLDLGCGSGVAALAAAVRAPGVEVLAVDANPRAVECTERGAALNGLTNVRVRLDAEAQCDAPGAFDLVLANPPYFSRHRIAEVFLDGAGRALKPGGTVLIVTKGADWFTETMRRRFRAVSVATARGYSLVSGRQP